MQPLLSKKILKLIQDKHLSTITVDIFDTIILNDYWPESLRYYDLAKRWVADLYQITTLQITAYELLSLHQQAQRELKNTGRSLQIDLILDSVLDLLCAKYNLTVDGDERLQILATMIATEIQFKINNSKPNHNLIAQLKNIKTTYPELKLYFITDTPLFVEQIKTMLQILDIKIFDGGVTSSDLGYEKQNGAIYEHLDGDLAADFDLAHNLHIGDRRTPDYLMPILHDSEAIHYRPMRFRGLRTLVGKTAMLAVNSLAKRRECVRYRAVSSYHEWEEYGALLAQYHKLWATTVQLRAELNGEINYLLTKQIAEYEPWSTTQSNVLLTNLDRDTVLKAFIWLLATFETTRWNAVKLLEILLRTVNMTDHVAIYRFCFGEDYVLSELALASHTDEEFYQVLLAEIKAGGDNVRELQESYEQVGQLLPRDDGKICIVEQSDDGTAFLFREFARLHGIKNEINEWILDSEGVLTKAEKVISGQINARRAACMARGRQNGLARLRQTELAADDYMKSILQPRLKKLVKNLG